jgi:hypothetical protein
MGVKFRKFIANEEGSLSVLILSFFMTILITLVILTDISAIYFAKRSLTQATEAAAQRGVRNLDLEIYYRGKYNATQFLKNLTGEREKDPGIPIDCSQGEIDARGAIDELSRNRRDIFSQHLGAIRIDAFTCDGYQISMQTSTAAQLPFVLPFINISTVEISSHIATFDERKVSTNYYGINIG